MFLVIMEVDIFLFVEVDCCFDDNELVIGVECEGVFIVYLINMLIGF